MLYNNTLSGFSSKEIGLFPFHEVNYGMLSGPVLPEISHALSSFRTDREILFPIQTLTKPPATSSGSATMRYPFLISIPHGGTEVPAEVRGRLALEGDELVYYSDPMTPLLYHFGDAVETTIDTPVSRMVVDLNRPPLPLPPKDPDGIIKVRTIDGRTVYREGQFPDMSLIHRLLMKWYFPYHQRIDELIDARDIHIAFDCHSMLPVGSGRQKDAGRKRPLICLGNNGDRRGRAKNGSIATCPEPWIACPCGWVPGGVLPWPGGGDQQPVLRRVHIERTLLAQRHPLDPDRGQPVALRTGTIRDRFVPGPRHAGPGIAGTDLARTGTLLGLSR